MRKKAMQGLQTDHLTARRFWNKIPEEEKIDIVEAALDRPEMSPRELAWHITDTRDSYISESSVFVSLKAMTW